MRYTGSNKVANQSIDDKADKTLFAGGIRKLQGLYLAKVIDVTDDRYEGYMNVEIIGEGYKGDVTNKEGRKEYARVRRSSPYGGSIQFEGFTNTYGMCSQPPNPGTQVLVAFAINSDVGICIGVLPDVTRNASCPTQPAARTDTEPNSVGPTYDPGPTTKTKNNLRPRANPDRIRNENSEFKDLVNNCEIAETGTGIDSIRGLSSSSGRRESPTQVFGFNTPGGHQFVMDDGTKSTGDRCINPDPDRQEGLSKLFRIRSAGGAQVLIHDGAGMIYISDQAGSTWIQMSSDGKIDIYAGSDISMHTEANFNIHCKDNFNIEADAINLKARGADGIKIESSTGEFNLHANKDIKLTSDLNGHIKTAGFIRQTSPLIDLNGPAADAAEKTTANNHTLNKTVKESIVGRVPEKEPWGGHGDSSPDAKILPQVADPNPTQVVKDIQMDELTQDACTGELPSMEDLLLDVENPRGDRPNDLDNQTPLDQRFGQRRFADPSDDLRLQNNFGGQGQNELGPNGRQGPR